MTACRSRGVAVATLILAVSVAGCTGDPEPAPEPTSSSAAAVAPTTPPPSVAGGGDAIISRSAPSPSTSRPRLRPSNQVGIDGQQVARSAAAARAAGAFMQAFARPDLPEQAWWARVAPLLTASGRHAAQGTDPARIPVTTVTGKAVVLPGAEKDARTVRVPTDIGHYTLFLLYDAGTSRWLVQTYQPPPDVK